MALQGPPRKCVLNYRDSYQQSLVRHQNRCRGVNRKTILLRKRTSSSVGSQAYGSQSDHSEAGQTTVAQASLMWCCCILCPPPHTHQCLASGKSTTRDPDPPVSTIPSSKPRFLLGTNMSPWSNWQSPRITFLVRDILLAWSE